LLGLLILLLAGLIIWKFYFDIYEVNCVANKDFMWADNQSELNINCYPINSFGLKVPFRNSPIKITIIEGEGLIDIIQKDEIKGTLTIKSRFEEGKVVIKIISKYALLPNLIEISIIKNLS